MMPTPWPSVQAQRAGRTGRRNPVSSSVASGAKNLADTPRRSQRCRRNRNALTCGGGIIRELSRGRALVPRSLRSLATALRPSNGAAQWCRRRPAGIVFIEALSGSCTPAHMTRQRRAGVSSFSVYIRYPLPRAVSGVPRRIEGKDGERGGGLRGMFSPPAAVAPSWSPSAGLRPTPRKD